MCGIVGMARRAGEPPVEEAVIRLMCDSIRHRGPDDEGQYVTARVGLGMRRLSIIDLSGGHQPIFNEDGTKAVILNGEIYNYRELRRSLVARGHRIRTQSDTETIVHLYEEYGADCVSRLRGMFAFAIWDASERSLLLARDRFGMKPLYVAVDDRQVAFASELKALCAAQVVDTTLDWEALDAYFRLGYIPSPLTPFRGVQKLEPGHLLQWSDSGGWTVRRYWDLPQTSTVIPENVEARVREWLDESVAAHLVSDVPLAALLSGGLDSSAVVSSMAISGAAPHAYTARYHGSGAEDADESELASALARRYGAKLTVVDIEPPVADLLEPIVRALDEPHADESAVPTWLISERVAQDYKVVLAGTGGDELFGGYRRHRGLVLSDRYTRLPAPIRSALAGVVGAIPEPRGGNLGLHRMKRFLKTGPGSVAARYADILNRLPEQCGQTLFVQDIACGVSGSAAADRLAEHQRNGGDRSGLEAALYLDYKTYLPDDILHVSDRISMAHSLEVRVPFVDHVLVERVFSLPDRAKMRLGSTKHLLRKALRPRLPKAHFRAPKRGFVGPTALWLRHELRDLVLDELSSSRLGRLGFFDQAVVDGFLGDHMGLRQNRESILWALLTFSIWHRVYLESGPT